MADIVDLAMDTTDYYAPPGEKKLDLRTKEGRAAAGLPPIERKKGPRAQGGNATTQRRTTTRQAKDYRPGIEGIGQLAAGALLFVSPADGAAVMYHTPPIANAVNDLAQSDPRVAALLDRLLQVGPYAALMTAVAPLVIQVMCNHGKLPVGVLGCVSPDDMVKAVLGDQA